MLQQPLKIWNCLYPQDVGTVIIRAIRMPSAVTTGVSVSIGRLPSCKVVFLQAGAMRRRTARIRETISIMPNYHIQCHWRWL